MMATNRSAHFHRSTREEGFAWHLDGILRNGTQFRVEDRAANRIVVSIEGRLYEIVVNEISVEGKD